MKALVYNPTIPRYLALQAVLDNLPGNGDRVLVIGGGVIGAMVVKSIRALGIGCDITVIEPSGFAAEYAQRSGADRAIKAAIIDAASRIAGGKAYQPLLGEPVVMGGFDRIFDTVGHRDTLNRSLRALATNGTLSVLGIGAEVKLDLTPLWLKLQTIRGVYAHAVNTVDGRREHVFETALRFAAEGRVNLQGMITHTFPLERYTDMIEVNMRKAANRAVKTAVSFP